MYDRDVADGGVVLAVCFSPDGGACEVGFCEHVRDHVGKRVQSVSALDFIICYGDDVYWRVCARDLEALLGSIVSHDLRSKGS